MSALFIFRRDLRLTDNTGLIELSQTHNIIPIFILDPKQLENNPYGNNRLIQFMIESLRDLSSQIESAGGKLYICEGNPHDVVRDIISKHKIDIVGFNEDYTPYARKRDNAIARISGVECVQFQDIRLVNDVVTGSGTVYQKFTPFYNKAKKINIPKPRKFTGKFTKVSGITSAKLNNVFESDIKGGRTEGLKVLNRARNINYSRRDYMSENTTTGLSPYNKFGCVSCREVYHKVSEHIQKEMFWRDFYYGVMDEYGPGPKFEIKWANNSTHFNRWKNGTTGFPIVDAGMRELVESGKMHNRTRMITSNFLVKVLGIDWRKGEKFFAQNLIDYDLSQNNGGWQWSAGTGADAQPYYRVFNPYSQSKKYDKDCKYIKKWIPELADVEPSVIHKWTGDSDVDYPAPFVDYKECKERVQKLYK